MIREVPRLANDQDDAAPPPDRRALREACDRVEAMLDREHANLIRIEGRLSRTFKAWMKSRAKCKRLVARVEKLAQQLPRKGRRGQ